MHQYHFLDIQQKSEFKSIDFACCSMSFFPGHVSSHKMQDIFYIFYTVQKLCVARLQLLQGDECVYFFILPLNT